MGMPAYIGYYVTHNYDKGYMTWSPHQDSSNVALEAGQVPTKQLKIKYQTENVKNASLWAFSISFVLALIAGGLLYYAINVMREQEGSRI